MDDLAGYHQKIKLALEQHGVRVLPNKDYSCAIATFQQDLKQDLNQCQSFVQLLNEKTCLDFPWFQYECAKAANLQIYQWRDKALDLHSISDPVHHNLLSQSSVVASEFGDFQEMIINQLNGTEAVQVNQIIKSSSVFINAIPEDSALAHQIANIFTAHNIDCTFLFSNSNSMAPGQIQIALEEKLRDCDAVLVIYNQNTPKNWVNEQVLLCKKMLAQRDKPYKFLAVYDKPHPDKQPLSPFILNLKILNCPIPDETCLAEFIRILTT